MEELNVKRTSISLPERLIDAAQSRLTAHYVTNFSDYVAALIRRDVLEHARREAFVAETGQTYMPNVPGVKATEVKGGTVMATKLKPPIVETIDLDAPFPPPTPQNVRKKKKTPTPKPLPT